MAWTAPKTWATGDVISASDLNTHLRDNLLELDTHVHNGSSGEGNDELTGLGHVTFGEASGPAAPGSNLSRLYMDTNSNPGVRSGSSGLARRILTVSGSPTDGGILTGNGAGDVNVMAVMTKGGVLVGDGATEPTELAVGSNTQILTADSGEASGVKWAAAAQTAPKEFFVPIMHVTGGAFSTRGRFPSAQLSASPHRAYASFLVPSDFSSLSEFRIILITESTGSLGLNTLTHFALLGELHTANVDSVTGITVTQTVDEIEEFNVDAALTSVTALDYVGVYTEYVSGPVVHILGFRFKYTV